MFATGALATLALEGLGTAAAGALAAVAEQGVAGEQLCLPCAVRAGGIAGALTVLTLGVGRVPAVQRFAGRMAAMLAESRVGLWAKALPGRLAAAAERVGLRRAAAPRNLAPAIDRPLFAPKPPPDQLELGAVPGIAQAVDHAPPPLPAGWPPEYDLSTGYGAEALNTFHTPPRPDVLPPGTRLYRIIGNPKSADGAYWTLEPPPANEAAWRGAYAVKNEWNGDGAYVEAEVGPDGLQVWRGPAAEQPAAFGDNRLPGQGEQVWMPRGALQPSAPVRTPWNR